MYMPGEKVVINHPNGVLVMGSGVRITLEDGTRGVVMTANDTTAVIVVDMNVAGIQNHLLMPMLAEFLKLDTGD
jgi:hypothetical protein